MDALAFNRKVFEEFLFQFGLSLFFKVFLFYVRNFSTNIRQYKEITVCILAQELDTVIGKLYLVVFFFYYKIQGLVNLVHIAVVIGHVLVLSFLKQLLNAFLTKEFNKRLVFRQTTVHP